MLDTSQISLKLPINFRLEKFSEETRFLDNFQRHDAYIVNTNQSTQP